MGGGGFEKKVSPEKGNWNGNYNSGGVFGHIIRTVLGLVYNTCVFTDNVCIYPGVHISVIHNGTCKIPGGAYPMPRRKHRKNGELILAAFVLGIITGFIMPGWWWALVLGVILVMTGCRILTD